MLAGAHGVVAAHYQDKVAGLGIHFLAESLERFLGVEFVDRRFHGAVLAHAGIYEALGADLRTLHKLGEGVELLAGVVGRALGVDAADIGRVVKYREAGTFEHIVEFDKSHAEAHVGLVGAVEAHRVGPCHAQERLGELDAAYFLEQVLGHALEGVYNVVLLDKAHLAVDLRELGLAVGAQVFVAEAFHNLEIAVDAGHHKQLFECLRALRQGIELALVHARGHDKVACALGGGAHEHRCLDFEETLGVEVAAHLESHLVTQFEVAAHSPAAYVEIAVFHADVVAAVGVVFDSERRHLAGIQHFELGSDNLDVAGGEVGVLGRTLGHLALYLHHELAAQMVGGLGESRVGAVVEHYLSYAVTVAEVKESHASHTAGALHPACQGDIASDIGQTQFAVSVGPVHIFMQKILNVKI